MQKHMLSKIAVATLFGVAACAVSAQNIAVVNGKPVPVERMQLLKQQIEERSGRELPAEMEAQLKEEVIAREIFIKKPPAVAWIAPPNTSKTWKWPAKRC